MQNAFVMVQYHNLSFNQKESNINKAVVSFELVISSVRIEKQNVP
jgi:hypothetical protein